MLVALTDAGRTLVDVALVAHAANELRLRQALDEDERAGLVETLRRLDLSLVDG